MKGENLARSLNDMHSLNLNADFSEMLIVHKNKTWIPVHDLHSNSISRNATVKSTLVLPMPSNTVSNTDDVAATALKNDDAGRQWQQFENSGGTEGNPD